MKTIVRAVLASCLVSAVLTSKCCAPPKWEGRQYGAGGGKFGNSEGFDGEDLSIFYDAEHEKSAITGVFTYNGVPTEFKSIFDYQTKKAYLILPNTQKCKITDLTRSFFRACIPDEATLEGDSYLGAGDKTLKVRVYRTELKDQLYDVVVYSMVTVDGCIPVSSDTWGTYNGTHFFENKDFVNITAGISDENVFVPPPYCSVTTIDLIADMVHDKYIRMMRF